MKTIKNVVELRDDLLLVYAKLRNREIGIDEVKQTSNLSGKIMSTALAQMEYNKMIGHKDHSIPFMDV